MHAHRFPFMILVKIPEEFSLLCKIEDEELSDYIRKLVALELFREGEVSLGKASEIASISVREMMVLLRERKISLHYSEKDLEKDITFVEEAIK